MLERNRKEFRKNTTYSNCRQIKVYCDYRCTFTSALFSLHKKKIILQFVCKYEFSLCHCEHITKLITPRVKQYHIGTEQAWFDLDQVHNQANKLGYEAYDYYRSL